MKALRCYDSVEDQEIEHVIYLLEDLFRSSRAVLPSDWNSRANFNRVILELDRQSSPGWPLCKQAPTIGKWLYKDKIFPDPIRSDCLWIMVQDVMAGKYDHHFKVFVKHEPHSRAKALEGRWRLIMASSLPVQVAWHMTIRHLEISFLRLYKQPLMHGLVYFGGGWKTFRNFFLSNRLDWCADKSGWDWNSPLWVYKVCKELRKRLTNAATDEWSKVLDLLYEDAFEKSKVVLVDGTILQQELGGLMKSGLVSTISDNGIAQIALHVLAEYKCGLPRTKIVATGDDTFQQQPVDEEIYIAQLQRLGCIVKEYGKGQDFMGFEITTAGLFPKYLNKHLVNLSIQKEEFLSETIEGYLRIYAHSEVHFDFFRAVAQKLGLDLPSRSYFLYFLNHPGALEIWTIPRPSFGDRVESKGVVA